MNTEKIPTAEEFLARHEMRPLSLIKDPRLTVVAGEAVKAMQEFAKLHVQAALKAASDNVKMLAIAHDTVVKVVISEMSIRDAYPPENIQ